MNRAKGKAEQKIIREADKIVSLKENVDALSWSRVQDIANELRGDVVSDERRAELARELVSISQANISLSLKLGISTTSEQIAAMQSVAVSGATGYTAPGYQQQHAVITAQESAFFGSSVEDDGLQQSSQDQPVVIPRASVAQTESSESPTRVQPDSVAKKGPTIEEVLADTSAATTHPIAPVPDDDPVTSDPLINNAAADQIALGIDKMVDDLEDRLKQSQQDKQPGEEAGQSDAVSKTEPVQQESGPASKDATQPEKSKEKTKVDKKKDKKKKRKEEKKARKAQKAERKAKREAEAKAQEALPTAEEPSNSTEQYKSGTDENQVQEPQAAVAKTCEADEVANKTTSSEVVQSTDGSQESAAAENPEASKMKGFATFKNVYSSRDARMSLFEDADGHLVAVDNSKLI